MAATVTHSDLSFRLQCEAQVSGDLVDDIGGIVCAATGSPVLDTSTPMLGAGSAVLDAIDDHYLASSVVPTNPGAASFSVSFIIDMKTNGNTGKWALNNQNGGGNKGWYVHMPTGHRPEFAVHDGISQTATRSTTLISSAGPTSVVCSYDVTSATGMKIYIDGVLEGTPQDPRAIGDIDSTRALIVGAREPGGNLFSGNLDEIAFYPGYVLTADDAVFLHNGGAFRSLDPTFTPRHAVMF